MAVHPLEIVLVPKNNNNEIVFEEYAIGEQRVLDRRSSFERDFLPCPPDGMVSFFERKSPIIEKIYFYLTRNYNYHYMLINCDAIREKDGIKFFCGKLYYEFDGPYVSRQATFNDFEINLDEIDVNNIKITSRFPYGQRY